MEEEKIKIYQRALAREKAARQQAEQILEEKSKELYNHIFSHIDLRTRVYFSKIKAKERKLNNDLYKWVSLKKINKYPTTLICRNILKNYNLI